ncbi:pyrroline-5-carboxylate reductase [Yoonia sp. SS1-5]|uniref:Pyrroline-5-carboxylate reductase n=1 Tax=Yoonia rhodophyticola TaxID=3137370 RepID=A0AAN0M6C8_9RHOB
MVHQTTKVVLVGAGRMGQAMLNGWLRNLGESHEFHVVDPHDAGAISKQSSGKNQLTRYTTAEDLPPGLEADVIVLATKPHIIPSALEALPDGCASDTVVVSVAAGIQIVDIERHLSGPASVMRVMPNIGAQVGFCVSAGYAHEDAPQSGKTLVEQLFNSIGSFCWLTDEDQMHAVTALSGSGPAYIFAMCEAMIAAGVELGIEAETAQTLAVGTVSAAGRLLEDCADPGRLREAVTSPNGTTAAGLAEFGRKQALDQLVTKALDAAKHRSKELS